MEKIHPYFIVEELCREQDLKIKLLKGSLEYAGFLIFKRQHAPTFKKRTPKVLIYGAIIGTEVTLGIATTTRTSFDLKDPESINKIKEFLNTDGPWKVAST